MINQSETIAFLSHCIAKNDRDKDPRNLESSEEFKLLRNFSGGAEIKGFFFFKEMSTYCAFRR